MSKSIFWRSRLRRLVLYCSGTYLAVFSALIVPAFGFILHVAQEQSTSATHAPWHPARWLVTGLCLGVLLIVARNYVEHRRVIYDPHWALNFQDRFDRMGPDRARAAKLLRENKGTLADIENKPELAGIDDVLDFFEDLGFYQRGDQISPEVTHHHFYHWARAYWQAAGSYVGAWRRKEPARWNHVEELFDTICDIELQEQGGQRAQLKLTDMELDEFLAQEEEQDGEA